MRGAAMRLTTAGSGFVVFLLAVPVIQGQDDWGVTYTSTQICAFKGSTVDIRCTYRYPPGRKTKVEKMIWFTRVSDHGHVDLRTDSEYAGRLQYHRDKNDCTLRITDLRESDSAEYKFRFITNQRSGSFTGSPGVTLSVTDPDLQVQVINSTVYQGYTWAELKCHSVCRLPDHSSYIWYKNGQKILKETSFSYSGHFYPADSCSCALKGREDFPSPSVCVHGQSCNRVTYTDRSICVSKGSSVNISCTYNSYEDDVESKFWFSPECSHQWQNPSQPEDLSEDSQYAGRVQVLETERGRSTLRITDLRESDSAQYHFKFKTGSFEWRSSLPGTTLTVTALQVQVTRAEVRQTYTKAVLKCHSSCSPAGLLSYIWYENEEKIREGTSYSDHFDPADSYSCALKGHEDFPSPSVCVHGQTCNTVTYTDRSVCASKGSSVDISCMYNSYEDDVESKFWFSSERSDRWRYRSQPEDLSEDSQYAGRVQVLETERGRSTLRITDLRESDSAQYHFRFKTQTFEWRSSLLGTTLTVTDAPKISSVSVSPSAEIVEGSSVTLTCNSDANPAAKYTWYKENQTLLQGPQESYHFTSISSEDRGVYYCKSDNEHGQSGSKSVFIDVQYAPKLPSVSVSPSAEIVEGSSVNLTCSSDANPAANYTWYKKNEDSPKASGQIFTISDFRPEHSGNYYCEAQNRRGSHNSHLHLIVVAEKRGPPSNHLSLERDQMTGIRDSQSRMTFTMPVSSSPRTKQTLCTPTSDQLSTADRSRKRKRVLSTLQSNSIVAILPREVRSQPGRIQLHCTAQSTRLAEYKGNLHAGIYIT